ncbi:DUF4280 domain-containing protein [bacterium D16-54]|nr:DUF4280 domain-containing protein [bacterium D16-54]RKJ10564.1 DUF4280 domain-containing protein [bacterium D16-56]
MGMMNEEERNITDTTAITGEKGKSEENGQKREERTSGLREGTLIAGKSRPNPVVVNTKPTDKEGLMLQEEKAAQAREAYERGYERLEAACEKEKEAEKAYFQAQVDLGNEIVCSYGREEELNEKLNQAADQYKEAIADRKKAEAALKGSQAGVLASAAMTEAKKAGLENTRDESMDFVVHMARIRCTYGMRESMAVLKMDHGVMSGGQAQMTVTDADKAVNFIDFGGCTSPENETVRAAAQEAMDTAIGSIEKGWADGVAAAFTKEGSADLEDEIVNQCIGECLLKFPAGALWEKGHEKVKIQEDALLVRRCELTCAYGGLVTILLSGQMG